jgi:hypothetical protein
MYRGARAFFVHKEPNHMANVPVKAGGDINPARFVTWSTAANQTVLESNSGDTKLAGIVDESTKNAPQSGGSTLHAAADDQARVHFFGDDCLLEIGTGGCTAGDFLKPDNDGKGVTASGGDTAGAQAVETAADGAKARVLVLPPTKI